MITLKSDQVREEKTSRVDVQYLENPQSISNITGHQYDEQEVDKGGHLRLDKQVVSSSRSEGLQDEGTYVSLLTELQVINPEYHSKEMAEASSYGRSLLSCQDTVQLITSTQTVIPTCSLPSIQPHNVEYSEPEHTDRSQYIIIQSLGSPVQSDTQLDSSCSQSEVTNAYQFNDNSNQELEDAVANITEDCNENVPTNTVFSSEQTFLVSTNKKGEIKNIHFIHDIKKEECNDYTMTSVQNVSKEKSASKLKKESHLLNRLKESHFSLKKFSLEELDNSGSKSKQQLFEEYLSQMCLKSVTRKRKGRSNGGVMLSSANHSKGITSGSFQTENAEEEDTVDGKPTEVSKVAKEETTCRKINSDSNFESSANFEDKVYLSNSDFQSHTQNERKKKSDRKFDEVPLKKKMKLGIVNTSRKKNKSTTCLIDDTEKSGLDETSDITQDNQVEQRLGEDCCRWFVSHDEVVLKFKPITLDIFKKHKKISVEIDVDKDLRVGALENANKSNRFVKYSFNICRSDNLDSETFEDNDRECANYCADQTVQQLEQLKKKDPHSCVNLKGPDAPPAITVKQEIMSTMKDYSSTRLAEVNMTNNKFYTITNNQKCSQVPVMCSEGVELESSSGLSAGSTVEATADDSFDYDAEMEELTDINLDTMVKPEPAGSLTKDRASNVMKTIVQVPSNAKTVTNEMPTDVQASADAKPISKKKKVSRQKLKYKSSGEARDKVSQQQSYVEKMNDGVKVFVCDVCGYMSKYEHNTRKHVQLHTATRDWVCDKCGLRLKSKHYLQKHRVVHQPERPFQCPLCPQTFKSNGTMKQHLQRHLGLKKFVCEYCSKEFVTAGDLSKHTRIHTGATPYKCPYCYKQFTDISSMYRHKSDQHIAESNCQPPLDTLTRTKEPIKTVATVTSDCENALLNIEVIELPFASDTIVDSGSINFVCDSDETKSATIL